MRSRLESEEQYIKQYFPSFRIQAPDDPERAGVIGKLYSNRNIPYVVWIPLGHFPHKPPKLYLIEPKNLRDSTGRLLSQCVANQSMHILEPDEHGHPQICHYNAAYWSPNISLYNVIMKCRVWLEAYEDHLITGNSIDHYLKHMR